MVKKQSHPMQSLEKEMGGEIKQMGAEYMADMKKEEASEEKLAANKDIFQTHEALRKLDIREDQQLYDSASAGVAKAGEGAG